MITRQEAQNALWQIDQLLLADYGRELTLLKRIKTLEAEKARFKAENARLKQQLARETHPPGRPPASSPSGRGH